ncbi:hypothetical protein [Flavilitoribacter nigricans]|uniref:Uncharacterized protein n=1 Tax=Flavilitoribacter nigricans (strain ATCC 23147 / DSM 23189 / NBRC 102662 / NCIMB 1420 / SS-2) TaxID=1122177 RepID=A0A2D0NH10_FLAN2|nr:hypothetical protein [Flavilitoribacter nigricans]PHN07782.1 hypothetical protein CRP01_04485 [Flavilitoribacter nigricans DSM 23189 = NBRC 102662]
MKPSHLIIILSSTIACTKPDITTLPPEPPNKADTTDTLTFTGYYQPEDCRLFINARITATGELVPDDTVEPQSCREAASPFSVEIFRFPNFLGPDHRGLRFSLNQHRLLANYQFLPEGFKLDSFLVSERKIYTFASPGHQHLQVFFPDTMLTTPVRQQQHRFSFQLVRGGGGAPQFTLLEGTYDSTLDLVNFQNLPDLPAPGSLSFSMLIDSASSSVRIRSIYHLLTEDFALWSDKEDCEDLQNWDLQLIPATGYTMLEAKVDPPFLKCSIQEEAFNFRIALLR